VLIIMRTNAESRNDYILRTLFFNAEFPRIWFEDAAVVARI
jgi:hypothetical protein